MARYLHLTGEETELPRITQVVADGALGASVLRALLFTHRHHGLPTPHRPNQTHRLVVNMVGLEKTKDKNVH